MSVNRQALKHIRQHAKKSQTRAGGKTVHIPVGNLVLLKDHPKGQKQNSEKLQVLSCLSSLPIISTQYKLYTIFKQEGAKRTVNRQQLFDLKRSQEDQITANPSIEGPRYEPKLKNLKPPQICHPNGTKSKNKAAPVSTSSVEINTQSGSRGHLGLGQWAGNLVGNVKDAQSNR